MLLCPWVSILRVFMSTTVTQILPIRPEGGHRQGAVPAKLLSIVFPAGALVLCAVAACQSAESREDPTPDDEIWISPQTLGNGGIAVAEAHKQLLPRPIVAGGRIAFDDQHISHVFSPVTGRITRVIAQLGQEVRKGTPLAAIASPDAASAYADEIKARADLMAAGQEYQRQKQLIEAHATSSRDRETAEDNYRKAKAEEERALQRLRSLTSGRVDSVTQDYILASRIPGRVVARAVNPGVEVQGQFAGGTAQELFTIGDVDSVWVYADVAESDLGEVKIGAPVRVKVLAYPERIFQGKVEWISPTLDPALRTGRIRCSLPNPDGSLKPEMYATVMIERTAVEALAVSRAAVQRVADHSFVYVAVDTRPDGRQVFKRRRVSTAEDQSDPRRQSPRGSGTFLPAANGQIPDLIAVLDGLAEGEKVLVDSSVPGLRGRNEVLVAAGNLAGGKVETVAVTKAEVPNVVTVGGRLTFDDQHVTHVFSPVSGRITRLLAAPGDRVKKGSPLVAILSPDLGSAFSDELKAKADLVAAEHEVTRQREMFALNASSRRDLEAAEDNFKRVQAEHQRAMLKTRLLRQGTFDQVSQEYVLRAPMEGEIIARMATPGLEVQGQYSGGGAVELFTVGSTDQLWLLGDVYEADLSHVKKGAAVDLKGAAFAEQVYRGTVDWISDTLDPATRTAKVRCVFKNLDRQLRPEMYVVVGIAAPTRSTLAVPRDALLRLGDDTIAFVEGKQLENGEVPFVRRRVVANEELPGNLVPVIAGLQEGERVASRGSIFFVGMM